MDQVSSKETCEERSKTPCLHAKSAGQDAPPTEKVNGIILTLYALLFKRNGISYFAKEEAWQFIERYLLQNSLSVYRLIPERAVGLRSPWVKWEGVGGSSKLPYITLMPYGDIPCKKPHIDLTGEENKVY